ncbi:MAG TPA: PD-(D/E)XK nuclease family protein [Candidatus Krumholzibacteria bacterium]|nr:PD-(D/E)XK nuclease family protein [Candidatus Krumholzibacteria bacterium]
MAEALKNTFQWSVSRDRTFRECPRQYWFNHYGFWGGWEFGVDDRTREIYVLKQLKSRATWVGEVVHDCIKHSVENLSRGIPVLPVERILEITRNRMRNDYRVSRDGLYRDNPKHACGFFEHEYRVPVTPEEWRDSADAVDRCLVTFYASEVWDQLKRTRPGDFLEIERFSNFLLDGVGVTVKLDCATRETDHVVVWDWKTGRREGADAPLQLACYAFYIHQAYGIPIHRVKMRRFELSGGTVHERTIAEKELTEILGYVRGSIADMQSLLEDRERNLAREDRFSKVERREACLRCNFLKVCAPSIGPGILNPRA